MLDSRIFWSQLLMLAGGVAVALGIFETSKLSWAAYSGLSWIIWAFYTIFSIFLFEFGRRTNQHSDKQLFGHLFLLSTGAKLIISLAIVAFYVRKYNPSDKLFIFPFFAIYLIFTGFELYFMDKLAKPTEENYDDL